MALRFAVASVVISLCAVASAEDATLSEHAVIQNMHAEHNRLRAAAGLRPMRLSEKLTKAACFHSSFMSRGGGFSHYNNHGYTSRPGLFGHRGHGYMENIAMGQPTVHGVFQTWLHSGGHRACLMSNAEEVGYGVHQASNGTLFWAMTTGTEKASD